MPIIVKQLLGWLVSLKPLLTSLLCSLFVVSALAVAYSAHQTRNMYRDLQNLEKDHDDLEHEYEKLILEQSAWADYTRLNQIALDKLQMSVPAFSEMVVLR